MRTLLSICLNPFVYFIGIMVLHDLLCKVSELSNIGKEIKQKSLEDN